MTAANRNLSPKIGVGNLEVALLVSLLSYSVVLITVLADSLNRIQEHSHEHMGTFKRSSPGQSNFSISLHTALKDRSQHNYHVSALARLRMLLAFKGTTTA
ncbi:hypothetical protein K7X08_022032 [Anisodus acutangulus]|uniref:Uncharacterized protein n=1 Tax=Anisodus acutangulus TaxID=402998 RepID=A0A9Q1L6K4_9SOLA|nr:hypothetical protein K7X08_022032 [Anisodus acutangulus]